MNIELTLSSLEQADLEQRAAAAGSDVPHFIQNLLRAQLDERTETVETPYEEWQADFRSWIDSQRSRNPQFDDSRESIYQ
jgi:hypothetical protein